MLVRGDLDSISHPGWEQVLLYSCEFSGVIWKFQKLPFPLLPKNIPLVSVNGSKIITRFILKVNKRVVLPKKSNIVTIMSVDTSFYLVKCWSLREWDSVILPYPESFWNQSQPLEEERDGQGVSTFPVSKPITRVPSVSYQLHKQGPCSLKRFLLAGRHRFQQRVAQSRPLPQRWHHQEA